MNKVIKATASRDIELEDILKELPVLAARKLRRLLKRKGTDAVQSSAALGILGRTVWAEAPKQELHVHITGEQIEEAKRRAGLLGPGGKK